MSIKSWIMRILGIDADVAQAVAREREQLTAKAESERKELAEKADSEKRRITSEKDAALKQAQDTLAEKDAAVRQLISEKEEAAKKYAENLEALRKQMADTANEDAKKYAELQARIEKYKKVETAAAGLKKGPGRPRVDRLPFKLTLDRGLKETITLLEGAGILKHGAVTNHINAELWDWLSPMREVLDGASSDSNDEVEDDTAEQFQEPHDIIIEEPTKPINQGRQSETVKGEKRAAVTPSSTSPSRISTAANSLPPGLTPGQQIALKAMESGEDVFLTGGAGTGKSYVIEQFVSRHDNVLLAAPTGLAARHIGGRTLHSLFKCDTGVQEQVHNLHTPQAFIDEIGPRNYKLLKAASTLIIDEISMVRQDMFDYVMTFMEAFKKAHHHIQIIVVGDFFQLAPVVTDDLRELWNEFYPENPAGYCFKSTYWKFRMIQLQEIVRQSDKAFADALNQIRLGEQAGVDWINENYCKEALEKGITLCPKKDEVKNINREHLQEIEGKATQIKTEVEAKDDVWLKSIRKDMRVEDILEIKPKARVMILVNDKENASEPRYHNGSMGEITSIDGDIITVKLDDGIVVTLEKNTWSTTIPEVVERKDEKGNKKNVIMQREVGHYTQFPVKLAWAATIHKSQGQTYEETNIKGNNVFGAGQIYVALSRATNIKKLHLQEPLKADTVQVSEEVKNFYGVA